MGSHEVNKRSESMKVITINEAKRRGIWAEVCKRNGWSEWIRDELKLDGESFISVDDDLIE